MDILHALEHDGHKMTRKAEKEYAGQCPWCGGDDRFHVWTENGRYWCRKCQRKGDLIQYYRDSKGLSYRDACAMAGIEPKEKSFLPPKRSLLTWEPTDTTPPSQAWQKRAFDLYLESIIELEKNTVALEWLRARGITPEAAHTAHIGWNPEERREPPESWGLQVTEDFKSVWIPKGLIIPYIQCSTVWRVRIRTGESALPYVIVKGGRAKPMMLGNLNTSSWLVTESELDGIMIQRAAGDLVGVIALGSASLKPDTEAHAILKRSRVILVNLDFDTAGAGASQWWTISYRQAKRWPVPALKDPGDYFKAGGNIRQWIEVGIEVKDKE